MNVIAGLLISTLSFGALAAEEFGGILFHSSVPKSQIEPIKKDLVSLYTNAHADQDQEFLSLAALENGSGPHLHNWLLQRMRYIVGESFELSEENLVVGRGFSFPHTPMPELPSKPSQTPPTSGVVTVMSNLGGVVYMVGKQNRTLFGVNFDRQSVFAKSPRVGIFKVGEGLFRIGKKEPKDPNAQFHTVSRLSTYFHEARHSDGNAHSLSFFHTYCPEGHHYAFYAACDKNSNGPYTIGALATRHMLKNCASCTTEDKAALEANIADSFSRILMVEDSSSASSLSGFISTYQRVLESYRLLQRLDPKEAKYQTEIENIEAKIAELQRQIDAAGTPQKAPMLDATPEGQFEVIPLKESMRMMERFIRR